MSYRDALAHKIIVLRDLIGSPHLSYTAAADPKPGDPLMHPNVGFVGVEHNQYSGWRVFEIMNPAGGERNLAEGMTVKECIAFLNGCILGASGSVRKYGEGRYDD